MSTSGSAHGSHGHGASAMLGYPEQAAPGAPNDGKTRKRISRPSKPLMVIMVAFLLFATLISLPWILDTIQDDEDEKKAEAAKNSAPVPIPPNSLANFAQPSSTIDNRFGAPRQAVPPYQSMMPPQSQIAVQPLLSQPSYQAIPVPTRPFIGQPHPTHMREAHRAPVQEFVPMGRRLADLEDEPQNYAQFNNGAQALSQAPAGDAMTSPQPHNAMPPRQIFSAPFQANGRQLESSIQAPAEAMARLLSGKDVPLDSYYAAIYGQGAVSPESGVVDHPPMEPGSNQLPPSATQASRQGRRDHGVYERHQMFVMR